MKIAFLYAGQGSQVVGMGKSFYDNYDSAKELYDQYPTLRDLSFNGPLAELSLTANTQPAMVLVAEIVTNLLREANIKPDYVAGLSLGEYSALYGAGVFSAKQAIDLVSFRGYAMTEAAKGIDSKMLAIIGLDRQLVKEAVAKVKEGIVEISNYNTPAQIVIGGEDPAVDLAGAYAKELGAKRVIPLNTSGPFHTSLLKGAGDALRKRFAKEEFQPMQVPVIFNATAKEIASDQTIKGLLELQVQSAVYFQDTIEYLKDQGVDTIIEIGPGKVLSGFVKKMTKEIRCYQVEDKESLEKTIKELTDEV